MALVINIKVVPNSGKSSWTIDSSGQLKLYVKSLPEKGKANKEICKVIAKVVNLPLSNVLIISGDTSRTKRIKIETDLTIDQFLGLIGLGRQQSIV